MSSEPIGVVESVRTVDGETIATVRLGAPTDADIETSSPAEFLRDTLTLVR